MTTHLLLLPVVPPPATEAFVAICQTVYADWCHHSRYDLELRWPRGTRAEPCRRLFGRTDVEPLAAVVPWGIEDDVLSITLTRCAAVARLRWMRELRARWDAHGKMEKIEVLWRRGGVEVGGQRFDPWVAVDVQHKGAEPLAAASVPGFDVLAELAEPVAHLRARVGCAFEGVVVVDEVGRVPLRRPARGDSWVG